MPVQIALILVLCKCLLSTMHVRLLMLPKLLLLLYLVALGKVCNLVAVVC